MAEMYASPAKRRKMCAGVLGEPEFADAAGYSSKATPSRLKGDHSSTPVKQKQKAGTSEPKTPGNKKQGSSTDDAALLSLSPQLLAPDLMLLNQLLGALYVTLPMVRSRGKPTTYHNMRVPVQNFCGRDFQVKHVQQIKALYPEALGWEHVLAVNPATKRQEQQLVISMPTDPAHPKQPVDTTQMQQTFFQRLQQHQACAGGGDKVSELPLAELPPAAGPSTRDCTPSRQHIGGLLPGTPQTAPPAAGNVAQQMLSPPPKRLATAVRAPAGTALMSPPPARTRANKKLVMGAIEGAAAGSSTFTFSPAPRQPDLLLSPRGGGGAFSARNLNSSTPVRAAQDAPAQQEGHQTPQQALRPNRLFDTPAAATPQQSSAARPNTHATPEPAAEPAGRAPAAASGVKVRKLTFDVAAPSAQKAAAAAAQTSEAPPKTRGGIKFELGESAMALLKQVSSVEVKQEAAAKQQELEQRRRLDMLPGSFEVLRGIYGERGPCVKPKAEVLTLLRQKSTSKHGMSAGDAAEQLDLMLRLVPDFLRLITSSGASLAAPSQSVRINRQMAWPAARQKLLAGAAEARCSGAMAAAAAVAAEQQREADEAAAAAAAAAAVDLDDSESEEEEEDVVASGPVDELGLDILAELDNNTGSGASSSKAGVRKQPSGGSLSAAALADEALALLGGGAGGSSSKPKAGRAAASGAVLGALAFKAPAKKGSGLAGLI